MTERDIQLALFRELGRRAQIAMPNYTPWPWYECDVCLVTTAGYMREYEIKLTVSDFRADVNKEHKHQRLAEGHKGGPVQFWYVTPAGLLARETLPPWAGLIELIIRPYYSKPTIARIKNGPRLHQTRVSLAIIAHMKSVCYWRYWKAIETNQRIINDRKQMVLATPAEIAERTTP